MNRVHPAASGHTQPTLWACGGWAPPRPETLGQRTVLPHSKESSSTEPQDQQVLLLEKEIIKGHGITCAQPCHWRGTGEHKAQSHSGPGWAQAGVRGRGAVEEPTGLTAALSGDSWARTHLGSGAGTPSLSLWWASPSHLWLLCPSQAPLGFQKAACSGGSLLCPPSTSCHPRQAAPCPPSGHP